MRVAALVAHSFPALEPVEVLSEPDPLKRLLRVAAHNVLQNELDRASKNSTPANT